MDASQLDFNNHFRSEGGLFIPPVKQLGEMIKHTIKGYYSRMHEYRDIHPRFPSVNINYIDNTLLNAVASKKNDKYYIGIYAGTFILLNELFLRMMSSPNILTEIGDSSKEEPTKKLFNPQQFDLNIYDLCKPDNDNVMPKDPTRQLYASLFTKAALNFLFDHEYAHIAFGHVDYLVSSRNIFSMEEKEVVKVAPLNYQTLEMDADCFATHQGMLLLKKINDSPLIVTEQRRPFFCGWENGMFNWLFAVYSLFRIFGYKNYKHAELLKYTHPPTGIRQRIISASVMDTLADRLYAGITAKLIDINHEVIDKVENAFNEISESKLNRDAINFAYTSEANQHIRLIISNWEIVKPKLAPYSFGTLER